jgi:hypothetical protein
MPYDTFIIKIHQEKNLVIFFLTQNLHFSYKEKPAVVGWSGHRASPWGQGHPPRDKFVPKGHREILSWGFAPVLFGLILLL